MALTGHRTEVTRRESLIDCFNQAGYYDLPKFENKQRLLDELRRFYVIDKACSALTQFKEGLSTLNVLSLMQRHPNLFEEVFCHEAKPLTASVIDGLLKVAYAEDGTRQREQEELIVMYWRDYLQDRQGIKQFYVCIPCYILFELLTFTTHVCNF